MVAMSPKLVRQSTPSSPSSFSSSSNKLLTVHEDILQLEEDDGNDHIDLSTNQNKPKSTARPNPNQLPLRKKSSSGTAKTIRDDGDNADDDSTLSKVLRPLSTFFADVTTKKFTPAGRVGNDSYQVGTLWHFI
jgi:hypothetical protein